MKFSLVALIIILLLLLVSCGSDSPQADEPDTPPVSNEELFSPSADDVADGTDFSKIIYSRPDSEELISEMTSLTASIKETDTPHTLLPNASNLQRKYEDFLSMRAYVTIMHSQNTADATFSAEKKYFDEISPRIEEKYGELLAAASNSSAASYFAEFFDSAAMHKYAELHSLPSNVTKLKEAESAILSEYKDLLSSPNMGKAELDEKTVEIFIRLLEIRSTLATELGYTSYTDYYYATSGSDYSHDNVSRTYEYIASYIVPVYNKLASRVLNSNSRHPVDPHTRNKMVNHLSTVLSNMDSDVGDVYSYMIYYGLFNIEPPKDGRISATVTTYLPSYKSPFLYATLRNSFTDYMLVCSEFGRFYYYFATSGKRSSEELADASSQVMALLALGELRSTLTSKEHKYLYCMEYESIILNIIDSSLYSTFEHEVYSLPYHEINAERIRETAERAIAAMGKRKTDYESVADVIAPLLQDEPFAIGSRVTSSFVALEIYFKEMEQEGAGTSLYRLLVHHSGDLSLFDYIEKVGLRSPMLEDTVKYIADSLHYAILGSHYFMDGENGDTAAADSYCLAEVDTFTLAKVDAFTLAETDTYYPEPICLLSIQA